VRPRSSTDSWIRGLFFVGAALMIAGVLLVKSNSALGGVLIAVGFVGSVAWNFLPSVKDGDDRTPQPPEPPRD
jgi:hypothetical protein